MIVIYHGKDEVLVTTEKWEHLLIEDYFHLGGRDLLDYERITRMELHPGCIAPGTEPEIIRIDLKCTVDFE